MAKTILIRALTSLDANEERAQLYEDAADNTGFPCWVEKYPMPKDNPKSPLMEALEWMRPEPDRYDPANCEDMWSLWTEWGGYDHSPFWREVERLRDARGIKA